MYLIYIFLTTISFCASPFSYLIGGLPQLRAHLLSSDDDIWCVETSIPMFLNTFLLCILLKVYPTFTTHHIIYFMDYVLNFGQLLFLLDNEV